MSLIRRTCADANKLLQDVLLVGTLDATSLKMKPTDMGALLTQRLAAHCLAAREKGLTLDLEVPPQPVQANLNADYFGRVVDNLVSNALKFTPAGGHVTVALREQAGRALLTVQDTGIGIPEALQANLFEKFSASARTGVGGGESARGWGYSSRGSWWSSTGAIFGQKARKARAPAFLWNCSGFSFAVHPREGGFFYNSTEQRSNHPRLIGPKPSFIC